jgi:hypothetical protein
MIPIYNVENELTHWVSAERCIRREEAKKKRTTDQRAYSKQQGFKVQFYITSHNLRAPISNLTGLLNLIEIYQSLILQKFLMDLKIDKSIE